MASRGVNKAVILGNVGDDPSIRYMPNGKAVANITVATSESWKDQQGQKQERTEWHRCTAYDKIAEIIGEYVKKGSKLYLEGKLQTRKWQDQQGQDRYTTEIKANRVQFLDRKGQGGGGDGPDTGGYDAPSRPPQQQQRPPQQRQQQQRQQDPMDDLGPAFPSEASGMDDVPF